MSVSIDAIYMIAHQLLPLLIKIVTIHVNVKQNQYKYVKKIKCKYKLNLLPVRLRRDRKWWFL